MEYQHIVHPFEPVFDEKCEILILGTLPSVQSRAQQFYYGHRQNRFWKVLAALFAEAVPETIDEKKTFLLRHHIALWDVIHSCDILGSGDSSIRNAEPADLKRILLGAPIRAVFANGTKAGQLYRKYQEPITGMPITVLPSTSPANAAKRPEDLCREWAVILRERP